MRKVLEGGVSEVAARRPCRLWCKRVRLHATGKVQDLPDGNTAEGEGAAEAPGGQRSVKGSGRERERKEEMTSEDQRSSVSGMEADSVRRARTRSMALFSARRRSFTPRKLWT